MKQTDLQWQWNEVIRGLDALQQVEANFQGRRFLFRNQLTPPVPQSGLRHGSSNAAYIARAPAIASRRKI
ncbi:MAG TPA: hypothetical protein VKH45_00850 [Candidatus Acidoferrum sp.]|nr:hypothetical protein [Candidatus Acidoferrum sp.]